MLGSVGLDRKLADRYPAQLSGGQQQRVGVARALAADPLVMLMDEPFSAVDPVVRSELHEFFLGLQRELSKTIILITHDIDEAIKLGDQVAILRVGGRLAQAGTPQEVLEEPADAFVEGFVGRDRGYRSLSFLPAAGLSLERVPAVREASSASGEQPTLVIDSAAKPLGWIDPGSPEHTTPLGSTFDPEKDTLRLALDSALTSPVGLAVAVGQDGRYAGVVSAASILEQVAQSRTAGPEAITVQPSPEPVEGGRGAGVAPENRSKGPMSLSKGRTPLPLRTLRQAQGTKPRATAADTSRRARRAPDDDDGQSSIEPRTGSEGDAVSATESIEDAGRRTR